MNTAVLLKVPGAELHLVNNGVQTLLRRGDLVIQAVNEYGRPQRVEASVADVAWPLSRDLPALKASPIVYSFGLPQSKEQYYVVMLSAGTPATVLESVADVIEGSAAFSTVKQVDAAYEEADALTGGKEAAAVAASEAQAGEAAPPGQLPAIGSAPLPGQEQAPLKYEMPQTGNRMADKVAAGLVAGGLMLASGIQRAASSAQAGITEYAEKQKRSTSPNAQPSKVSPAVTTGLKVAGVAAGAAVTVTGWAVSALGSASYAIATGVASALSGGKKRAGDQIGPEQHGAMKTIGAAGLVAYVEVYDALEGAAKLVASQSGEAATGYIEYKYGAEAGAAAKQSLPVAADMMNATLNFTRLGARAFISKTAKRTAKMYFKSTVAGLSPQDQAAGQKVPAHLQHLRTQSTPLAGAAVPPGATGYQQQPPLPAPGAYPPESVVAAGMTVQAPAAAHPHSS